MNTDADQLELYQLPADYVVVEVLREALSAPVAITVHGRPLGRIVAIKDDLDDDHGSNRQQVLDNMKHRISCEVLARFSIEEIKQKSISNIERWRAAGTVGQAYAEWMEILLDPENSRLITAMVGHNDQSNQLRQSMPFVGMLDQQTVKEIHNGIRR